MAWFKGTSIGNHGFYHEIKGCPVNFPRIQFYEYWLLLVGLKKYVPQKRGAAHGTNGALFVAVDMSPLEAAVIAG